MAQEQTTNKPLASAMVTFTTYKGQQWTGTYQQLQDLVDAHALLANIVRMNEENRPTSVQNLLQEAKELIRK